MKRARSNTFEGCSDEIILNVGGKHFSTCLVTLQNCPDGLLAKRFQEGFRKDNFFIDRCPKHFESILNWLRSLRVDASLNTVDSLLDCRAEAMYFCLGKLVAALDIQIKKVRQQQRTVMMNLVLFGWFAATPFFGEMTDIDMKSMMYAEQQRIK